MSALWWVSSTPFGIHFRLPVPEFNSRIDISESSLWQAYFLIQIYGQNTKLKENVRVCTFISYMQSFEQKENALRFIDPYFHKKVNKWIHHR